MMTNQMAFSIASITGKKVGSIEQSARIERENGGEIAQLIQKFNHPTGTVSAEKLNFGGVLIKID